jgi:hypothetical protein
MIPTQYETWRWQHRLFAEMRKETMYRRLFNRLRASWEAGGSPDQRFGHFTDPDYWIRSPLDRSSTYYHALEQAAIDLRLTKDGKPVNWAVEYLHDDVLEAFDPHQLPMTVSQVSTRLIEISISPAGSIVDTFSGWNSSTDEVRSSEARHQLPMMIGKSEWSELERLAVAAAELSVADLRADFEQRRKSTDPVLASKTVRAGSQEKHNLAIKKLAQRLTGWNARGDWNTPETDANWCKIVGIDPARQPRK